MEAAGLVIAPWVKEMLAAGCPTFYRLTDGQVSGFYDWATHQYQDLPANPRPIKLAHLRQAKAALPQNSSASLHNMGDGVLLLEFHAKMNAIDDNMIEMLGQARTLLDESDYAGLVIGNEGENFCAGANLLTVATAAQQGKFDQIEALLKGFQEVMLAFRYHSRPVVVAAHSRALGGGAEIVLQASRVVAHAESYIGLVEFGVGLIPAGGGVKELVRRIISPAMQVKNTDPLPPAQSLLEIIGLAKVSGSAAQARELGFLEPTDRIIMNRDQLLYEAKQEVLTLAAQGYTPPTPAQLYAGGRDLYAALKQGVWIMRQGGYMSDHDLLIGDRLAYIIAGGDLSTPQWVAESYFLDLERQAFMDLVRTEKTQARMWYMLQNGQPLRN
jgi:3-hydroxyacyl-CoA dehydrogenase